MKLGPLLEEILATPLTLTLNLNLAPPKRAHNSTEDPHYATKGLAYREIEASRVFRQDWRNVGTDTGLRR